MYVQGLYFTYNQQTQSAIKYQSKSRQKNNKSDNKHLQSNKVEISLTNFTFVNQLEGKNKPSLHLLSNLLQSSPMYYNYRVFYMFTHFLSRLFPCFP